MTMKEVYGECLSELIDFDFSFDYEGNVGGFYEHGKIRILLNKNYQDHSDIWITNQILIAIEHEFLHFLIELNIDDDDWDYNTIYGTFEETMLRRLKMSVMEDCFIYQIQNIPLTRELYKSMKKIYVPMYVKAITGDAQ
jgi:hypothetical protein